jgi:hypothetical protein
VPTRAVGTAAALCLVVAAAASGLPVGAARVAGVCGAGTSDAYSDYQEASGPLESVSLETVSLASGIHTTHRFDFPTYTWAGARLSLAREPFMADGAYAAVVKSFTEVGGLARTSWPACGGSAIDNQCNASTDVLLPYAVNGTGGETSIVTVQNADQENGVLASVTLYGTGATVPALTAAELIPAASSKTLDLGTDPEFQGLGPGFVGWMRVTAQTPIAVQSWVNVDNPRAGVYAFEGIPAELASERLLAPLVYSDAPLDPDDPGSTRLTSRIAVVAMGTHGGMVETRFFGTSGVCLGQVYKLPPTVLPSGGGPTDTVPASVVLDVLPDDLPPGEGLPAGCAGSALVQNFSGGELAAVVLTRDASGTLAAAYDAAVHSGFSNIKQLPTVRNQHGQGHLTTAIQVANYTSDVPAEVRMTFFDSCGNPLPWCGSDCLVTLPADGGANLWWPPRLGTLPAGMDGSARVECSAPCSVAAVEVPLSGGADAAAYLGLALYPRGAVPMFPLILRDSAVPAPTDPVCVPPSPTATRTVPPTTTPPPTGVGPGATPSATLSATTTSPPTAPATATPPPTATPVRAWCGGPGDAPMVDPHIRGRVPAAAIADALANPDTVSGWGQRRNPGVPYHVLYNPCRTCLTLRNARIPYHPAFNGLIYSASCR